jgi:hypothetical protein
MARHVLLHSGLSLDIIIFFLFFFVLYINFNLSDDKIFRKIRNFFRKKPGLLPMRDIRATDVMHWILALPMRDIRATDVMHWILALPMRDIRATDVMHWILALTMRDICGEFHEFLGTKNIDFSLVRYYTILGFSDGRIVAIQGLTLRPFDKVCTASLQSSLLTFKTSTPM